MFGNVDDTIYALATPYGRSGVAVIRISGPAAYTALSILSRNEAVPPARRLVRRRLYEAKTETVIDDALIAWFPGPNSFTGESVVEFHLHGSRAVMDLTLEGLSAIDALRLAQPGEFTARAYRNKKMTLTEVEGLGSLIDADTARQHAHALRVYSGAIDQLTASWTKQIDTALAKAEASLDFSDEGDIADSIFADALNPLAQLVEEMKRAAETVRANRAIRDGIPIVILGAPNAGKSSLLNAIVQRPASISSPEAGTTRDLIEVDYNLDGYRVTFVDTAGLRSSPEGVEAEGIERAMRRARDAHIALLLTPIDSNPEQLPQELELPADRIWQIQSKSDLSGQMVDQTIDSSTEQFQISSKTGSGISRLLKAIAKNIEDEFRSDTLVNFNERQAKHMFRAAEHIKNCLSVPVDSLHFGNELQIEELRLARLELGNIVGYTAPEDVLGRIFSSFCIGK